jgi:hypothetical protein
VKNADQECGICHGDHGMKEKLPPYEINRLTGYSRNIWGKFIGGWKFNSWDSMKMNDCADCHSENDLEENNACGVCHK